MLQARLSRTAPFIALIGLAIIAAAGCTSISDTMQKWVGHHYSELIAAWGPPDQTFSDGHGGQIYIYTRTVRWVSPATSTTTYQQNVTHGTVTGQSTTVYNPAVTQEYTSYRMFWINADGIIYSWSYRNR